jgi:AcrR family transcriptional regulator
VLPTLEEKARGPSARLRALIGPVVTDAAGGNTLIPQRRRTDVRAALIEAGERILERDGLSGLTVRAVAAEAGVAPQGVYNHLRDKDGLLLAVLGRAFDRLAKATAWRADLKPRESLRAMCQSYRRFALASPVAYGLMFGAPTGVEPDESIREHAETAFAVLLNGVLMGQQLGTLREGEPLPLAMSIWSAVHGAVGLEIAGTGPAPALAADHYDAVIDMIETGLAPQPEVQYP